VKTLTLLRHAKSGWDDPVARDFDRPLNPRGRRAARTVGRHLHSLGLVFDHVIASPALRVRETIGEFDAGYGRALAEPVWDRRLYLASAATLLDVVRETRDAYASLLVVGHNPGLEDLVLALAPDEPGQLRDAVEEKYPTATVTEMTFAVPAWPGVAEGGAILTRFIRPRDLDPALGPQD
jgi:phosphohistidine phosphatase